MHKTIEKETAGGVLERIEKTADDGGTFYEIETRKAGMKVSFKVNAEGQLVAD